MQTPLIEGFQISNQQQYAWDQAREGRIQWLICIQDAADHQDILTGLEELVAIHEILRTRLHFKKDTDLPLQVIDPEGRLETPVWDWRSLNRESFENHLEKKRLAWKSESTNFAQAPLFRTALILWDENTSFLYCSCSLLGGDASTPDRFMQALAAVMRGQTEDDPMQYADFTQWSQDILDDEDDARRFWSQVTQSPPALGVMDEQNPLRQSWERQQLSLDEETWGRMEQLAKDDLELCAWLIACWGAVLCRFLGRDEQVIGVARGLDSDDLEGALGPFDKYLPIGCESGVAAFERSWRDLSKRLTAADHHQEYFLYHDEGEENGSMVAYDFAFEWVDCSQTASAGEVRFTLDTYFHEAPPSKLLLSCVRSRNACELNLYFNPSSFEASAASGLLEALRRLVSATAADLKRPTKTVALLKLEDYRRQAQNDEIATPKDAYLHERFEHMAMVRRDELAVVSEQGAMTYGELNNRAEQIARFVLAYTRGKPLTVGICMQRSCEFVAAILGVLKAGGAYTPLDPDLPTDRLAFMLADAQACLLLTQSEDDPGLSEGVPVLYLDDPEPAPQVDLELVVIHPDQPAYLIYTSGSTGAPKAVAISHRNAIHSTDARFLYYPDTVTSYLLLSPLTFDSSVAGLWWTLGSGGMLCLPHKVVLEDPGLLAKLMRDRQVSHLLCIPSFYQYILEEIDREDRVSLRTVIVAGEACPTTLAPLHERLGARGSRLYNEYGPTEATVWCSVHHCRPEDGSSAVPIGTSIPHGNLHVVDAHLNPLPPGFPGELVIEGVGLALGYWNRPGLTAEKFIPNPFGDQPGQRLYKSGDLARCHKGGVHEYLGRIDRQVKVNGFRIELGEIESTLLNHPSVHRAVVTDRKIGENQTLLAYVTARAGQKPDPQEIKAWLGDLLAHYMVPTAITTLEALPLTRHGKVDIAALPDPVAHATNQVTPRTETEKKLVEIWRDVLNTDVGLGDNFFHMGGHSLLAARLITRVRDTFGMTLDLQTVFEKPTVQELTASIDANTSEQLAGPERRTREDGVYPLSFGQQRLWFLDQLQQGSAYHVAAVYRLRGKLEHDSLNKALEQVVQRHEILRTTFKNVEGEPRQVVGAGVSPAVEYLQASEDTWAVQAEQHARQSFDLAGGPLLRLVVFELQSDDYMLLVNMHHIISDGWSATVLLRELSEFYSALLTGKKATQSPLSLQYADYAQWQWEWLKSEEANLQKEYWHNYLRDLPQLLNLPSDRPRPQIQTTQGAGVGVHVPQELTQRLIALAQQHQATLFMVLMTAFQILLSRISGERDLAVGAPVANREFKNLENLIGFFVNTIVFRGKVDPQSSFVQMLERTKQDVLAADRHKQIPFESIVDAVNPDRDLSHSPLFQVLFTLQNRNREEMALPGLEMSRIDAGPAVAKFDLSLDLIEQDDGLLGRLVFNTEIFDQARIEGINTHFMVLLESIVSDAFKPVKFLEIQTQVEKDLMVVEWNQTAREQDSDPLFHEQVEAWAERTPEAVALGYKSRSLSYAELNELANRMARGLKARGVNQGDRVGLCVNRSPEMIIGLLAILKAGGVYVPLDETYPASRLEFMIEDSEVKRILCNDKTIPVLSDLDLINAQVIDVADEALSEYPSSNLKPICRTSALAYMIYTSGTTGRPKGAVLRHAGWVNLCHAQRRLLEVTPQSRILQFSSICFDASVFEFGMALGLGASLQLGSAEELMPGPALVDFLESKAITHVTLPPSVLKVLPPDRMPRVRCVVSAGEACSAQLSQTWSENRRFINAYGPTETTVCATMYTDDHNNAPPIGRPIDNFRVYLCDRNLCLTPLGSSGQLCVSGVGLATGYKGRPGLTAERFTPDPFSNETGGRLYHTGDLAFFRTDGQICYQDRLDHQVKIRGFRIEPGEIQARLQKLDGVCEAAVTVLGSHDKRLAAYVVAEKNSGLTEASVRDLLRVSLPEYMVPSYVVMLEALPLNASGKLDRKRLPKPGRESTTIYQAPKNELEKGIASIWSELLERPQVGLNDNFFDLGGHSLMVVKVHELIRERLGVELAMVDLFKHPTIESLAGFIQRRETKTPDAVSSKQRAANKKAAMSRRAQKRRGGRG